MDSNRAAGQGPNSEVYRFGDVIVDAAAHTLERAGQEQTIEPKAFAVLLVLLRRHGELIGRDELLDLVWGHRHVTPGVLTRVIAQLRHALDDDAQRPRYIQTQHALGYRFVGSLLHTVEDGNGSEHVDPPLAHSSEQAPAAHESGDGVAAIRQSVPSAWTQAANETQQRRVAVPATWRSWLSRRKVGLLIVALLASAAVAFWLGRQQQAVRPIDASIAVLPFTSLSDDKADGYFADGLAAEMQDALAGVPGLKVIAASQPGDARGKDAKTMGKALGVATVLDASVRRDGARVRINARLTDTRTGYTLWADSYDRESRDVFALQSDIASEVVRSLLGVLPGGGEALTRRLAPTRNVAAYDAYLKGRRQMVDTGDSVDADRAIDFFRGALAIDPGFARAQAGICRAEITRFETVRDAPAFDRAKAACDRATAMDPSLREVSLALGELYRARGESAPAIAQYTRALEDPALRADAYLGLAQIESALGNTERALGYFERARRLSPRDARVYRARGYHQYINGDVPVAIESYRIATSLQPDNARQWSGLGGLYMAAGDNMQAAAAYERSLEIEPNYSALSNLGTLKYNTGAYAEAADLYRHAAAIDPSDFRLWGNLGDALSASQDTQAQAHEPYQRAADMAERYLRIKPDEAQAFAELAWYRANLGDEKGAREMQAKAEAIATERGEVAFWGAQTMARLGDGTSAREHLEQAQAEGIPVQQRIAITPVLRRLVGVASSAPPPTDRQ